MATVVTVAWLADVGRVLVSTAGHRVPTGHSPPGPTGRPPGPASAWPAVRSRAPSADHRR